MVLRPGRTYDNPVPAINRRPTFSSSVHDTSPPLLNDKMGNIFAIGVLITAQAKSLHFTIRPKDSTPATPATLCNSCNSCNSWLLTAQSVAERSRKEVASDAKP